MTNQGEIMNNELGFNLDNYQHVETTEIFSHKGYYIRTYIFKKQNEPQTIGNPDLQHVLGMKKQEVW